jgi:hypothetical protein
VRTQSSEQPDVILQRTLQNLHPHARFEPQLRQLDQPAALARTDLSDNTIGNPRRDETIHHQAPHAATHLALHQPETISTKA